MSSEQQGQAALGPTLRSDEARVSRIPGTVDPTAAAQLALAGGNPDDALTRLTRSLRTGLTGPRLRDGALITQLPAGADPFRFFGSPDGAAQADAAAQHTQDLPREAPAGAALDAPDSGGPVVVDRRVALMAQDMAAFGGVAYEASQRFDSPREGPRFDYFA